MKAALLALVLVTVAPAHLTLAVFGQPVALPASWILAGAELPVLIGGAP